MTVLVFECILREHSLLVSRSTCQELGKQQSYSYTHTKIWKINSYAYQKIEVTRANRFPENWRVRQIQTNVPYQEQWNQPLVGILRITAIDLSWINLGDKKSWKPRLRGTSILSRVFFQKPNQALIVKTIEKSLHCYRGEGKYPFWNMLEVFCSS